MAPALTEVKTLDAERQAGINRLYRNLARYGREYMAARNEVKRIHDLAEPMIVSLAQAGEEQIRIARSFNVVRETIRRIEIRHGIDRGDPRAAPGSRIPRRRKSGSADMDKCHEDLMTLGQEYKAAIAKARKIRDRAEPIIVTLAEMGEEQIKIARHFNVVRETIRRIEIRHGIDRGDPRAAPGSRVRKTKVGRPKGKTNAKTKVKTKVKKAA